MMRFFQKFYSYIRFRLWWWNFQRTNGRIVSIYLKSPRHRETATEVMVKERMHLHPISRDYVDMAKAYMKTWEVLSSSIMDDVIKEGLE